MITITYVLLLAAFLCTMASITKPEPRIPLWVAVFLVILILALQVMPK